MSALRAFLAALLSFVAVTAVAEIAPMFYERMQQGAPEALLLDVLTVDKTESKDTDAVYLQLTVRAKVLRVERTKAAVKTGDVVTLAYGITQAKAPRAGMGEPPLLTKGQQVMAYLQKSEKGAHFELAAAGRSFTTPAQLATPPPPR